LQSPERTGAVAGLNVAHRLACMDKLSAVMKEQGMSSSAAETEAKAAEHTAVTQAKTKMVCSQNNGE